MTLLTRLLSLLDHLPLPRLLPQHLRHALPGIPILLGQEPALGIMQLAQVVLKVFAQPRVSGEGCVGEVGGCRLARGGVTG